MTRRALSLLIFFCLNLSALSQAWAAPANGGALSYGSVFRAWKPGFVAGPVASVFDVTSYGAVGNGTTDDTSAINAAIAALNSAGRGILYFPAGAYKITGALTTISAFGIIRGDGNSTIPYGGAYSTAVLCTANNVKAFTVSSYYAKFENLVIANTAASTPVSGSVGVEVNSAAANSRVDFDSVTVERFYIGVDVVNGGGGAWSIRNSNFFDTVQYHLRVNNGLSPTRATGRSRIVGSGSRRDPPIRLSGWKVRAGRPASA